MSDEPPRAIDASPPKAKVICGWQVGAKCLIAFHPDEEGGWLEAGGAQYPQGVAKQLTNEDAAADGDWQLIGATPDNRQARVYFHGGGETSRRQVRVVLPDDAPFRASRKGKVDSRSKSFDQEGDPVREVRLLYALKTGRRDDRRIALDTLPLGQWSGETFGEIFAAIDRLVDSAEAFEAYVGGLMARSATDAKGLSDWALREKVADDAAVFTRMRLEIRDGTHPIDNNGWFIQAVKETTLQHKGLPAQIHVKERWLDLGGIGEFREIRKTLGFEWLPTKREWDKFWKDAKMTEFTGG